MYARVFSRTTKLLPSYRTHFAPDGMHIVLDMFLLAVSVTIVWQLLVMRTKAAGSDL